MKFFQNDLEALKLGLLESKLQCSKSAAEYQHRCRVMGDTLVYDFLKKYYGPSLQHFWDNEAVIPPPGSSDRTIVIVERRCHPNFLFCIQNAIYYCRGFGLTIVCSETNRAWIETLLGKHKENVHIMQHFEDYGTSEQGKLEYNNLLQQYTFWESISAENILIIETDSYLLQPIPESILEYDYVGSKWPWQPERPGGGGLTFRHRSAMIKICENLPVREGIAQDCFAADAVVELNLKYDKEFKYFVEADCYRFHPVGVHQWWTYMNQLWNDPNILLYISHRILLKNCPMAAPF